MAGRLTWTRRERRLDDLDLFNQMLAIIETGAHLDVLVLAGELDCTESGGVRHYWTGASSPAISIQVDAITSL